MTENQLSFQIRKGIFKVYDEFGPGLFESVYESSLAYYLSKHNYRVEQQKSIDVIFDGERPMPAFRADIIVESKVILEIKSVESMHKVHHKQLITYLKLSGLKLGLLINFNTDNINKSIFRKVNGL